MVGLSYCGWVQLILDVCLGDPDVQDAITMFAMDEVLIPSCKDRVPAPLSFSNPYQHITLCFVTGPSWILV